MSAGQLARHRSLSRGSGHSRSATGASQPSAPTMDLLKTFEPAAATASLLLYAQGPSILCLHHDTLALDRRFQRHSDDISFIAVDNVSERGAGRHVVSYDTGQTAIVWDLFTGDEIARFSSYERLCVASWMRNGNVAFGNIQGNVILFEPSTSEHISARTIFDPVTAIAPAADCRTYAIGYMNGSILIAALQPSFTILHTLTTSRAPSPIVTLAWHASSSKQKSDMLATQTEDGDLRVWSISKYPNGELPKVVRVLRRSENYKPGPNWLGWSKNGRVIQYTDGETFSWDVRTKHVTYEPVPTLDIVNGLALHGATATLFTLGRNHTVQQYDLNPPTLVANKQHPPPIPPPSPPVSIEELKAGQGAAQPNNNVVAPPQSIPRTDSGSEEEQMSSPLQKIANEMDQLEGARRDQSGTLSPTSSKSRSRAPSVTSRSSNGAYRHHRSSASTSSKITSSEGTAFSIGSSLQSGLESGSAGLSSPSIASSRRSRPKKSRLRQEVLRSPEEVHQTTNLFPFAKGRLSDVPYKHPQTPDLSVLTAADLRRQMLSVVFGWDDDIEPLIQDELRHHKPGSVSAVLLSKWLGDVDADLMASMVGSETMTSSDWMLLALSQIGGQASTKKVGQAFVQRLLEKGDVHAAATILLGLGDQSDAVEVYVSHRYFMEAVLLTCLVFPNDWQRQSELVRKWGEYSVQHSQQHLAIRCFSCTGMETLSVLTSPRAQDATHQQAQPYQSLPQILSPPLSPPGTAQSRMKAKNSALKLITTFGDKNSPTLNVPNAKFFGLGDDVRTPVTGAGVTPIAESAVSPGGAHPFARPSARSMNNPESARTATPGGYGRLRLSSIGETPVEETPRAGPNPKALPTPVDSGSDKEKNEGSAVRTHERKSSLHEVNDATLTLSSAKYNPESGGRSPMSQVSRDVLPSPAHNAFTAFQAKSNARNGSRDRKPDGLQIQWPPMESIITGDYMSPGSEASDRPRHRRAHTESGANSQGHSRGRRDKSSPPQSGNSLASSVHSQPVTGKSIDRHISSLEEAQYYDQRKRDESRRRQEGRSGRQRKGSFDGKSDRGRYTSQQKDRQSSEDRGRSGRRYIKPAKRSPSSPIPMSPDDFRAHGVDSYDDERYYGVASPIVEPGTHRDGTRKKASSKTRAESSGARSARHRSPERLPRSRAGSKPGARIGSAGTSRRASPDAVGGRGRSTLRAEGSLVRSPSSPLPMSPQAKLYKQDDDDEAELRAVEEDRKRFKSRQRSTSRRPQDRGTSGRREESPDHRRRDHSVGRPPGQRGASARPQHRDHSVGGRLRERVIEIERKKSERTLKKEQAAKELEERRLSLARRPSAPAIPYPSDIVAGQSPLGRTPEFPEGSTAWVSPVTDAPERVPSRSKTTSPTASSAPPMDTLTPRAMRHPKYMGSDSDERIPAVPEVPDNLPVLEVHEAPKKDGDLDEAGALPSSVYAPPPRLNRSISAPAVDEPSSPPPLPAALPTHPAFQYALPPSSRSRTISPTGDNALSASARKVNPGEAQPGTLGYESRNNVAVYSNPSSTMVGIDETIEASNLSSSNNNNPPANKDNAPAPPLLPELQHLAQRTPPLLPELQHLAQPVPPPPPPPPSQFRPGHSRTNSMGTTHSGNSGASGVSGVSGVINIGIEGQSRGGSPTTGALSLSPPLPGHSRGRSTNDTLSGKFTRATQRMRSGSRNRNKSPPMEQFRHASPYESIPPPPPPPMNPELLGRSHTTSPHLERHPRDVKAGMTPDMVRNGFTDGGMI
ncbi:MAG: hypothetical protein M1837_002715 [Sclerophora amabilis]|nr:MAG: hypothetical protein M1837_002715 [Sclerophora amabilis]